MPKPRPVRIHVERRKQERRKGERRKRAAKLVLAERELGSSTHSWNVEMGENEISKLNHPRPEDVETHISTTSFIFNDRRSGKERRQAERRKKQSKK